MTSSTTRATFQTAGALASDMAARSPRHAAEAVMLLLVLTIAEGAGVLLLPPLLELAGVMEVNPLPRPAGWLQSGLSAIGARPTLGPVLVVLVALAALRAVAERRQSRLVSVLREDLVSAYRLRLYRAMVAAEWQILVTRTPSEFAHALTAELTRVGSAVLFLTDLAVTVMAALLYLALALRLSPGVAILVLASAGALAWSLRATLAIATSVGARSAATRREMHRAVAEHVSGIKTARCYGVLDRQVDEFVAACAASRGAALDVTTAEVRLRSALDLGSTLLLAVIVYVSSTVIHVPPALLLVLLFVFARLTPRLINAYRLVQSLTMALPAVDAVNRLEADCRRAAEPTVQGPRDVVLTARIRFEDVSFTYPGRTAAAISALNLSIEVGRTTAIVGASGSGKTTVADLLMGLLSPTQGRIVIDDEPLGADAMASWRRQVAYVPQDTFLLHDTVKANLLWASPAATDQELSDALSLAAASEFVARLPFGVDTVIGEGGALLSGGERQRLSIARALLRRPQVLVLDEATSTLDSENEDRIQRALDALRHRLTIVLISHRLSTIRHADIIHVLERGRLLQSGAFDRLADERTGPFSALTRVQARDAVGEPG